MFDIFAGKGDVVYYLTKWKEGKWGQAIVIKYFFLQVYFHDLHSSARINLQWGGKEGTLLYSLKIVG